MTTAVDIFAGMGGWSTGAVRTGIEVVAAINHDAVAIAAHNLAHPTTRHYEQDVSNFPWAALTGIDVVLASPSCKDDTPASQPSKRGTGGNGQVNTQLVLEQRERDRNTAWSTIEAIATIKPRLALIENVQEFYIREDFNAWRSALSALGYHVRCHTINAWKYGAVVDRPRAVITAMRDRPVELHEFWWAGVKKGMRDCLDYESDPRCRWRPVDSKPERLRNLIRTKQAESRMSFGILNNVGDGVRMRHLDELAPSFTTQTGTQLMLVDHDRVRILNPLELTRMMGWLDGEIEHALPRQRKVAARLIGNAISPAMTEGVLETCRL